MSASTGDALDAKSYGAYGRYKGRSIGLRLDRNLALRKVHLNQRTRVGGPYRTLNRFDAAGAAHPRNLETMHQWISSADNLNKKWGFPPWEGQARNSITACLSANSLP